MFDDKNYLARPIVSLPNIPSFSIKMTDSKVTTITRANILGGALYRWGWDYSDHHSGRRHYL